MLSTTTPMGRDIALTRENGDHYEIRTNRGIRYVFDSAGRLSARTDPRGRTARLEYDGNGRLWRVTSPYGRRAEFRYLNGRLERVTAPDASFTHLAYDTAGNLATVTDHYGRPITYLYDAQHRMTSEDLRNGTHYTASYDDHSRAIYDGHEGQIVQVYCPSGFPASRAATIRPGEVRVIDGRGHCWMYHRDNLGRVDRIVAPNNGPVTEYHYGDRATGAARNRLVRTKDGRNHLTQFDYYPHGRLHRITDAETNEKSFEYDEDLFLRRTKITKPDGTEWTYAYDPLNGDWISRTDPDGSTTTTFAYEILPAGHDVGSNGLPLPGRTGLTTVTDRNGYVTRHEYNGRGNLVRTTTDPEDLNLITEFDHDLLGRVTQRTVHRGDADVVHHYAYDPHGQLLSESVELSPTEAIERRYIYDGQSFLVKTVDPRGIERRYIRDHRNRLTTAIVDSNGPQPVLVDWRLDGNGNAIMVTDANGNVTINTFNEQDYLIHRLAEPSPGNFEEAYFDRDEVGNLEAVRVSREGLGAPYYTTSFVYDALDRVTQRIISDGTETLQTLIAYTPPGGCDCGGSTPGESLPHRIQDPAGKVTYLHYDLRNRLTKVVRKVGDVLDAEDADDVVIQYIPNLEHGLDGVVGPEGERVAYGYDAAYRPTVLRRISADPSEELVTRFDFDGAFNLRTATEPSGHTSVFHYDRANRLTSVDDGIGERVAYTYDPNSNVRTIRDGNSNGWTLVYDNLDQLRFAYDPLVEAGADKYLSFQYDPAGNLLLRKDRNDKYAKFQYDGLHRLVKAYEDFGGDDQSYTAYGYTTRGQLETLSDDEGHTTTYAYDDFGRLLSISYPDTSPGSPHEVALRYDLPQNLITRTDQNGVAVTLAFDDLHRLVERTFRAADQRILLQDSYAYDRSSRLTTANNALAEVTFGYDGFGRADWTEQRFLAGGGFNYHTTFHYTIGDGESTRTLTYPRVGGPQVTEYYDARSRLARVESGSDIGASWEYDNGDRRTFRRLRNWAFAEYGYDGNDRVTSIIHELGGPDPTPGYTESVSYRYDAEGNRLTSAPAAPLNRGEVYEYDGRNRLREFRRGLITWNGDEAAITEGNLLAHPQLPATQVWDLDSRGNWETLSSQVDQSSAVQTRTHNGANELLDVNTDPEGLLPPLPYVNDDNGNLLADPLAPNAGPLTPPGQRYVYDAANRLTAVWRTNGTAYSADDELVLTIHYDALSRRVETIEHVSPQVGFVLNPPKRTWHVYAGLEPIMELDVAGTGGALTPTLAREFVWGASFPEPVAMIDYTAAGDVPAGGAAGGGPEVLHYQLGALGSVTSLTNAGGDVVERYTYDPYGGTHIESEAYAARSTSHYDNPWMWTGQRYDPTTHQYHFTFRTFSTSTGRWLQRDPLEYVDGLNLYQYVLARPAVYTDKLGLNTWAELHYRLNKAREASGQPARRFVEWTPTLASSPVATIAAWTPIIGDANDASTILTGYDALSGETVSTMGRVFTAGAIVVGSGKAWRAAGDATGEALERVGRKIPNPFGSRGKPDHRATIEHLKDIAKKEFPDHKIEVETQIHLPNSNRKPDVQAVDPTSDTTVKVWEAQRDPNSKYNKTREAEYTALGVEHETHAVGSEKQGNCSQTGAPKQ